MILVDITEYIGTASRLSGPVQELSIDADAVRVVYVAEEVQFPVEMGSNVGPAGWRLRVVLATGPNGWPNVGRWYPTIEEALTAKADLTELLDRTANIRFPYLGRS